jgi:hypothetical protein
VANEDLAIELDPVNRMLTTSPGCNLPDRLAQQPSKSAKEQNRGSS